MTTQQIIDYYKNLLILQYRLKPKALATIDTVVAGHLVPQGHNLVTDNEGNPVFDNEGQPVFDGDYVEPILPLAVQQAFDIDTAVGVQLDSIAKYVGVFRQGFDFSGAVTLTDAQMREMIKIVGFRDRMTSKLTDIQDFLFKFFPDAVQVFDNGWMHISYVMTATIGSNILFEFFVKMGLLPRPLGVGQAPIIYDVPAQSFFAFRTVDLPAPGGDTGFNSVADPQVGTWLTTAYGLPV